MFIQLTRYKLYYQHLNHYCTNNITNETTTLPSLGPIWGSHESVYEANSLLGLKVCSSETVQEFRATYSWSKIKPSKKPEEASGQLSSDCMGLSWCLACHPLLLISCLAYTLTMNTKAICSSEMSCSPWTTHFSFCHLLEIKELSQKAKIQIQTLKHHCDSFLNLHIALLIDSSLAYNTLHMMSRNYWSGSKFKICFCCLCHSQSGTNQSILCSARKNYLCSIVEWYREWPKIPLNIQSGPRSS